jgi:hypothetical protein
VAQIFEDDVSVNGNELAACMRVSRWTVYRWKDEYKFEFGRRTTTGHLKARLRPMAQLPNSRSVKRLTRIEILLAEIAKADDDRMSDKERKCLESELSRLR